MSVKFIYFDLGNVLFKVDHGDVWNQTLKFCDGGSMELMERFYSWGAIIDHMIGNTDDQEFFKQMKQLLGFQESAMLLESYWKTVFHPLENRFDQVSTLSGNFELGALSNISPVHSKYIQLKVPHMKLLKHFVFSWKVGFVKPRDEIFEYAQRLCGFEPGEILFIDDQQCHVDKAIALGWHGICLNMEHDMLSEVDRFLLSIK